MRRQLLLFVAAAVAASGMTAIALGCGAGERSQSATFGPLRFSYPASFERRYPNCKRQISPKTSICIGGIVVASFPLGPYPGEPSAMASPDGVALRLHLASDQKPLVVAPTVRFPVSLAEFYNHHHIRHCYPSERRGRPCPPRQQLELFFQVKGKNYWALAWVGKDASKPLRVALAKIVSSLRPT